MDEFAGAGIFGTLGVSFSKGIPGVFKVSALEVVIVSSPLEVLLARVFVVDVANDVGCVVVVDEFVAS